MSELFTLAMPWWEFLLRAFVVYAVLLALVRLAGKRTVGQFTPFDLILVVLLGNAVQNSLLGEDHSLLGGLILAAALIGLNWLVGMLSARSKALDRVFAGAPVLLARNGSVYRAVLTRENISDGDFAEAMREAECTAEAEIQLALLETDGKISIVRRAGEEGERKPGMDR